MLFSNLQNSSQTQVKVRHILSTSAAMLSEADRFASRQSFSTSPLPSRINLLFHRKERKSYFDCPLFPAASVRTKQDLRLFFTVILYFQFKQ